MADDLSPLQCLECRRDARPDSRSVASGLPRYRGDRGRTVVRRRDLRPSPSLCGRRRQKSDPHEPSDHALGRSRGGFSTKIHLLCDGQGHPLAFHLTAGQAHESTALAPLLERAEEDFIDSCGPPLAWPMRLAGDKAYRADWIDELLESLGITPVIPSKSSERNRRAAGFDPAQYRRRNLIERVIGWLKECRRVFARFEKTALNYAGMLKLAIIQRYLKLIIA
ncbi:Transposase DDE domain [Planctomycetales bacterium 10988]|nr:Transposase DDE domain [Planctomycetales bacterium 10988]